MKEKRYGCWNIFSDCPNCKRTFSWSSGIIRSRSLGLQPVLWYSRKRNPRYWV